MCVKCVFLEPTATDCVAVVHRRTSQLSSSGLMNIRSSHSFSRSGNDAFGCIDGIIINSTEYEVGVIGGKVAIQGEGCLALDRL